MSGEHFAQFFPAICAGLGLFLVGGANLLLCRRGVGVRAAATLAAVGLAVGAAAAVAQPGATAGTATYLAVGLFPCVLLASRRAAGLVRCLHRPAVRFGVLSAAGVALAVGSVVVYELQDAARMAANTAEMELIPGCPPCVRAEGADVTTDRGTRLNAMTPRAPRELSELRPSEEKTLRGDGHDAFVIRRGPPDDHSNCHGWVFTGGRYLIGADAVALILRDNGYQEVQEPQAGDVVIYRAGGEITHTAVVRYVAEGQPVLVEGKWGNLGVYLHPADRSMYGTDYTFYRSERDGHLVAGIGKPAVGTEPQPVVAE